MLSQLEEEICNVEREGSGIIPIKNGNSGASVNDRVPEVNFGRGEVEDWGDTEGN